MSIRIVLRHKLANKLNCSYKTAPLHWQKSAENSKGIFHNYPIEIPKKETFFLQETVNNFFGA